MEKMPLELRQQIYEIVLRNNEAAKDAMKTNNTFATFNVPLFRVNRRVRQESRKVFFETNTIHVRPDQILDLLYRHGEDLRQLHVEGWSVHRRPLQYQYFDAVETLMRYAELAPRLKLIEFECIGLDDTVRQLARQLVKIVNLFHGKLDLNIDGLRCVNVGTYVLQIPEISQEWRFAYSLLEELWDAWTREQVNLQPQFDDLEGYFGPQGPVRIPEWVSGDPEDRTVGMQLHNLKGLEAIVGRYSDLENVLPLLKPQAAQMDALRRFELVGNWRIKERVRCSCLEFAGCTKLHNVCSDHGTNTLEWATELLAPNVQDFAADFGETSKTAE